MLYTDGLVERRGTPLDVSLQHLARTLSGVDVASASTVAEELFEHFDDGRDDDAAVLVVLV